MRRTAAVIGTAIFFVFVPCVLARVVDFALGVPVVVSRRRAHALRRRRADSCRRSRARGFILAFRAAGARHAGADRPDPTPRRYRPLSLCAQPIFVAVAAVIFGQVVLFGDWRLFAYGALFCLVCHLFVVDYEEPTLKKSFGAEYQAFRVNVPRGIPRLTAWRGGR
jgi:hypothetical protein